MKTALGPLVWAEVDLAKIRRNLRRIRSWVGPSGAGILAVVKADAYGHGMKAVARMLACDGVDFFGVANIDEASELRSVCPRAKILVLGSFHAGQLDVYISKKIIPTLSSVEDASLAAAAAKKNGKLFPVHVKIDTGMGRLGVWHEDAVKFFEAFRGLKGLSLDGLYTHFSSGDDNAATRLQVRHFTAALAVAKKFHLKPLCIHAANSLGLARMRRSHLNLVRPGIILYGLDPSAKSLPFPVEPALTLKTRISFLKQVKKGRTISYNATFKASKDTVVATLPIGYSHGYRIGFSNRASVIVGGKRCPVIGRVTMDQTLIDVGAVPGVRRWDEVVLIGRKGDAQVTASELAAHAGTISYEIACAIHPRIPRIYKEIS